MANENVDQTTNEQVEVSAQDNAAQTSQYVENQRDFVFLAGHVSKAPEVHVAKKSGNEYLRFQLATISKTRDGNSVSETKAYYNVSAFGKNLVTMGLGMLAKGDNLLISGTLDVRQSKGKDGKTYTNYEVLTRNVGFDLSRGLPKRLTDGNPVVAQIFDQIRAKNATVEQTATVGVEQAQSQIATKANEVSQVPKDFTEDDGMELVTDSEQVAQVMGQ
jgi:single-stranded DNA-binding protein